MSCHYNNRPIYQHNDNRTYIYYDNGYWYMGEVPNFGFSSSGKLEVHTK